MRASTLTVAAVVCFAATARASQLDIFPTTYNPVRSSAVVVTAQVADYNGVPVATAGITVNWSLSGAGSLGGSSSVTDAFGVATATLNTSSSTGATCTVTASATGYTSGTTTTIATLAAAGPAHHYLVTAASYGVQLSTGVTMSAQLVDANNNPVSASRTVTWSTSAGGFASSPTNGSGVATSTFTTGPAMATYVVTANDGAFSGTSAAITTEAVPPVDTLTTPVPYVDFTEVQAVTTICGGCHFPAGRSPRS